jgi:hypothetical protein
LDAKIRKFFERLQRGEMVLDAAACASELGLNPRQGNLVYVGPCPWDTSQELEVHVGDGSWQTSPDGQARGVSPLRAALEAIGTPIDPEEENGSGVCAPPLDHSHPALAARGLDPVLCGRRRIGIVADPAHRRAGWLAVSVFDILGRCVGLTFRRPEDAALARRTPRWSLDRGFPRGRHLFNLDYAWPSLARSGIAIVVEGPFDAIHLERGGWPNTVALLGNRLTAAHVDLLLTVGVSQLVLLLDNDHGGREGRRWALECDGRLDQFEVADLSSNLPRGHDPDDLPHEALARLLEPFRPRSGS